MRAWLLRTPLGESATEMIRLPSARAETNRLACYVASLRLGRGPTKRRAAPRRRARESVAFVWHGRQVAYPCPQDLPSVQGHPRLRPRAYPRLRIHAQGAGRRPLPLPHRPQTVSDLHPRAPYLHAARRPDVTRTSSRRAPIRLSRASSRGRLRVLEYALRSHNPRTPVSGRCRALRNRLTYAGFVAHGCVRLLRVAPWVVSAVVSFTTTMYRRYGLNRAVTP
jgi:hypothetical protein